MNDRKPLTDSLAAGPVICAEGFPFELERRGYLTAGSSGLEVQGSVEPGLAGRLQTTGTKVE